MNSEALLAKRVINRLELRRVHLPDKRDKGLHEDVLGPWAVLDGSVEDVLRLGSKLVLLVAEADVGDPDSGVISACVARKGVLEGCPRRVGVARLGLVTDGKHAAAGTVVRGDKDVFVKDGAHSVVDTEPCFPPSVQMEEYSVLGKELNILGELLTEECWTEWP